MLQKASTLELQAAESQHTGTAGCARPAHRIGNGCRKKKTHHANNGIKLGRGEAQACHDAANAGVAAGDKGVGTKVNVQHGCVGSLYQDAFALAVGLVDIINLKEDSSSSSNCGSGRQQQQ